MTTFVGSTEAARLLGVTKPTLYAYVSRGLLERRTAVDGRTSLYARDEIQQLAARGRTRDAADRPSIDTKVTSSITELSDEGLRYRQRDVAELAATCSFEQVAELLWCGEVSSAVPHWAVDHDLARLIVAALEAAQVQHPIARLAVAAAVLDGSRPDDDPVTAGRTLLALTPSVLAGRLLDGQGNLASQLLQAWGTPSTPQLEAAVNVALVLLADHELATSTLAVRVATSVRASTYAAVCAGLSTVRGVYHGGASSEVAALFAEAASGGVPTSIARRTVNGARLPGFGHSVYRHEDPRLRSMLNAVAAIPGAPERHATVRSVQQSGTELLGRHANIDFGLGALIHVADLPFDMPVFAVARIAGWVAHDAEERTERPVRYRGLARLR